MLIVLNTDSSRSDLERVCAVVEGLGLSASTTTLGQQNAVLLQGFDEAPSPSLFASLPGVSQVFPVSRALDHVRRDLRPEGTRIRIRTGAEIGGDELTLIAGPCAVESAEQGEQLLELAQTLKRAGATLLRGGAYKPRTSPYEFSGLGEPALRLLAGVARETGLGLVTEALDEPSLELAQEYADIVQIGARNMQNFSLLRSAGQARRPVLLKRGMSADLEDLLFAAEYVLNEGNSKVILCERGIRTFSRHSRFTLDLSIVPRLKQLTHLPVIVDPSHASGIRESVGPLSRAAVAVGADGVMVEVHADPDRALCDGPQSLDPTEFTLLATELRGLAPLIARRREVVS